MGLPALHISWAFSLSHRKAPQHQSQLSFGSFVRAQRVLSQIQHHQSVWLHFWQCEQWQAEQQWAAGQRGRAGNPPWCWPCGWCRICSPGDLSSWSSQKSLSMISELGVKILHTWVTSEGHTGSFPGQVLSARTRFSTCQQSELGWWVLEMLLCPEVWAVHGSGCGSAGVTHSHVYWICNVSVHSSVGHIYFVLFVFQLLLQ